MIAISKSVVLVVDDDALVRVHSNFVLEDAGYEVVEASNAADALIKLDERPDIAALFTDIRMPGALNGIDLANAVHARRPDIAIVVTSGVDTGRVTGLPETARFVQKPYTGAQLRTLLAKDPLALAPALNRRPEVVGRSESRHPANDRAGCS